ncbi:MAG: transposase [Caldilineaceae bacterium]|nr:transposase [Caldilineaceae bacterium]
MRRVLGVGPAAASAPISQLPEPAHRSGQMGAALVGVAPLNQDSGQQRGLRCAWGACAAASKNYYMATMTAFRHNPATPAFHICLCQRGKSRKVALVASRRKLPLILNAVIQDQFPWQPRAHGSAAGV